MQEKVQITRTTWRVCPDCKIDVVDIVVEATVPVADASQAGGATGQQPERIRSVSEVVREKRVEKGIQQLVSPYYHGRPLSGATPSHQLSQPLDETIVLPMSPKRIEVDSNQKRWDSSNKGSPSAGSWVSKGLRYLSNWE